MAYGEITQEGIEKLRQRINQPRRGSSMYGYGPLRLTRDLIRRFAYGIGDDNPLYHKPDYAERSPHGTIIAPPSILGFVERANGATDGLPGCHTIWREAEYEWVRPLRLGDAIEGVSYLREVREVESKFSGRAVVQNYETIATVGGEEVGRYRTSWHRFDRRRAAERQKYAARELATYTKEDIARIREEYRREVRRGAEPRYFEDVTVGEELPPVVKGPTTTTSKFAFEGWRGAGGWFVGHRLAFELFDRHPGLAVINEQGIPEPPVAIHWSNERCQRLLGLPGAYEAGYERTAWICHLLTNWMSDYGHLRRLTQRYPTFSLLGDTTWCRGKVIGLEPAGERGLVRIEVHTVNQRGDVTTTGEAEVLLPRRGAGNG